MHSTFIQKDMEKYSLWIGLLVGLQEGILAIIPNKKVKGIFGYVIDALKFSYDYINRGK